MSRRDLIPILASGLLVSGVYVIASPSLSSRGVAAALLMGIGLMVALAGMQGRAETLTILRAVKGWLRLAFVVFIAMLAAGRITGPNVPVRSGIFLIASLAASLLLFVLRTRRR